jgi:hypothetical protein
MFMCVVNLKAVNKLDLTWKQSFLIILNEYLRARLEPLRVESFMRVCNSTQPKVPYVCGMLSLPP